MSWRGIGQLSSMNNFCPGLISISFTTWFVESWLLRKWKMDLKKFIEKLALRSFFATYSSLLHKRRSHTHRFQSWCNWGFTELIRWQHKSSVVQRDRIATSAVINRSKAVNVTLVPRVPRVPRLSKKIEVGVLLPSLQKVRQAKSNFGRPKLG